MRRSKRFFSLRYVRESASFLLTECQIKKITGKQWQRWPMKYSQSLHVRRGSTSCKFERKEQKWTGELSLISVQYSSYTLRAFLHFVSCVCSPPPPHMVLCCRGVVIILRGVAFTDGCGCCSQSSSVTFYSALLSDQQHRQQTGVMGKPENNVIAHM